MRKKKSNLKGPSLTIKWAFASSLFIFVVFTIFAVITYKSAVNLIVEKERAVMERTVNDVIGRLSKSEENLTLLTVLQKLQESTENHNAEESGILPNNVLVSELNTPGLSVYVYNAQAGLIFSNNHHSRSIVERENKAPTILTLDGEIGFLMVEVIISQHTQQPVGYVQAFYQLDDFFAIRSQLLITLLILEVIALVVSGILGYFLAEYFLKPIDKLNKAMKEVRKNPQNAAHITPLQTNDELQELSETFNEMQDTIHAYIKQQEQFVSDVSHELRTPVAIVEGHLKLLNRWGKDDPKVLEDSISASLQETERMKSLVEEMLTLSRAGAMDPTLKEKTTKGREVITQVINNFRLLRPEFELTLHDEMESEKIVQIYRNHLEQLAIIVLENAIKYSTDIAKVDITISATKNSFIFSITDYGEGMEKEEIDKVFGRFYRIDKARARATGGNGLGLPIAKQLIENYKGRVKVDSEVEKGTTFTVVLPLAKNQEDN